MRPRWQTVVAFLLLAAAIGGTSSRFWRHLIVPGAPADPGHFVFVDFVDAVYYATVAFIAGDNPYDQATYLAKYPVLERCSLYSPISFVMHAPLALLSFVHAAAVYFLLSLVLTVGIGVLALRWARVDATPARIAGLGAFLIAMRPGRTNLMLGQVTVAAVLFTYVALRDARKRPWVAAAALAAATFKGTFGIPLAALMFLRGEKKTVMLAVLLGVVVTVPATARLVHAVGGPTLLHSFAAVYDSRRAIEEKRPEHAPFRVDVVALAGRMMDRSPTTAETAFLSLAVFGVAAAGLVALRRRGAHPRIDGPPGDENDDEDLHSAGLVVLAIVVGLYHQIYDVLALTLPLVVLSWRPDARPWRDHPRWRLLALAALLVPFLNFFSAESLLSRLGLAVQEQLVASSVNAVAILVALLTYAGLALRWPRPDRGRPANGIARDAGPVPTRRG